MEGPDILAVLDEVRDNLVCGTHGCILGQVAAQAARVVAEAIRRRVFLDVGPFRVDGSKVHGPAVTCQLPG